MQRSKLIYVVSGVLIILLIGWAIHTQRQLADRDELLASMEDDKKAIIHYTGVIAQLDSLVATGNSEEALNYLNHSLPQFSDSLATGLELYKSLILRRRDQVMVTSDTASQRENEADRVISEQSGMDQPRIDSLLFIIMKSNLQIQLLKEQLTEKESGAYLVFETTKGDTAHYVGQIADDKANGIGVALFSTGSRYEGSWRNNQRHGKGAFYWTDGQVYKGTYKNDRRSGYGTYYWANGDRFEGNWSQDIRSGSGTFYNKSGKVIAKGVWKNDELVEVEKD